MEMDKDLIKTHDEILLSLIQSLIRQKFEFENGKEFSALELFSGSALKDMFLGCIDLYLEEVLWIDKEGEPIAKKHRKIPPKVYSLKEYIKYLYHSHADFEGKGLTMREAQHDAKNALILYCYEQILRSDGLSMGQVERGV